MSAAPHAKGALLAIEASQRDGSVALAAPDGRIVEVPLGPADQERDRLLPAIDRACRELKVEPRQLSDVAVSIGPGGFTGLRISVATAKALWLAVGCRVIAVPTALVAAAAAEQGAHGGEVPGHELLVALASKGDDAWVTRVTSGAGSGGASAVGVWSIAEAAVVNAAGLQKGAATVILADEFLPAEMAAKSSELKLRREKLRVSASACLAVGAAMRDRGEFTDPAHLEPLYPREPEAVRLWRIRSCQDAAARPS